jgi:hypothetical protein
MNSKDIPNYRDPDTFISLGKKAKFPCSTNSMKYNVLMHRYYLTNEALEDYGIDVSSEYMSGTAKKIEQFIQEVSDDLYGAIQDIAPFNYKYMCYLIASSRSYQFPDKYAARKQFERALIYQAQYKINNIDVRDINGIDLENNNSIYHKQLRKEHRHISPKSLEILKGLGLFYNGNIPEKCLINYSEVM